MLLCSTNLLLACINCFLFPFQNGLSKLDHVIAEKTYRLLFQDKSKIKKVSLRKISVMDEENCSEYQRLAQLVRPVVSDPDFFKISLFLLLTGGPLAESDR